MRWICTAFRISDFFSWMHFCVIPILIYSQRASHPRPPDFHADLWGNSRGSSLRKFPHDLSAEMKGEMKGNVLYGYFRLLPCGIPGEFSVWKFPSCFPQKFQSAMQWHRKGPSYVKISQWWFDVILWWIEMYTGLGKLPSHFNPILKFPLNFRMDSRLQPKFPCGFSPPTTTIPGDSPW